MNTMNNIIICSTNIWRHVVAIFHNDWVEEVLVKMVNELENAAGEDCNRTRPRRFEQYTGSQEWQQQRCNPTATNAERARTDQLLQHGDTQGLEKKYDI